MRILGIDFGSKSIGLAVSDETGMLARGLKVIPKQEWEKEIPAVVQEYNIGVIVVGLPRTMQNTDSYQTERTLSFIDRLKELTGCAVTKWDERLSSRVAERYLLEADMSRGKRKKVIDRLAAQVILQDYLDFSRKTDYGLKEAEEM